MSPIMVAIKNNASVDASRIKGRVIMFYSTSLSTVSKAVLGLILSIVAATAAAEEYFTIKDGQLERPTGFRE